MLKNRKRANFLEGKGPPSCAGITSWVLALLFGLSHPLWSTTPGTSTANFLKLGIGARGSAMGEAQSAVVEDVTATYWNPAGLTTLRFKEISVMHDQLVEGVHYQQASYGFPTETRGTFALGASLLDYGSIQGYDNGSLPTGSVKASNLLLTASWGKRISDKSKLSLGTNFKYLKSDLAGFKASAPIFDFGLLLPVESGRLRGLRLSTGLRNLGPNLKYDRDSSPLPRTFVLGAGLSALGGNLALAMDFLKPRDNNGYLATGLEYKLFDILNLRVGYNSDSDFVGNGISYGMGLRFTQWNLDYALVPFGDLGNTNRISVGVRFGRALQIQHADDQVEFAYRKAERQLSSGKGLEAFTTINELLLIAPWHKPSVELKAKIQKQFEEMSTSKNRARLEAEMADRFSQAKAAFDRDELVEAKKGFETILMVRTDHVGSKVYLERIQNRYASIAEESFKEGMGYFAAADYLKAKTAFEKTLTINPDHVDAMAQLDKTNLLIEDSTKRAKEMELLADAAESYKAGLEAYQKNNLEEALKKFEEVAAKAPQYEEVGRYTALTKRTLGNVLFEQAQVQKENGHLDEAVKKLQRAAELVPDDSRVKPALAVAERDLALKNSEESKQLYKQGLESYLSGQTSLAAQFWERALELDSSNEDALQALSKLEEQKKYEKAE